MNNPKTETIQLLSRAIGDGTIKVHFKHISTYTNHIKATVRYTFEVNGRRFETGWHDTEDCDFLHDVDYCLINTQEINLALWYLSQGDTVVVDAEQMRRQAQAAIDKAMNALLGPCPF